jgi:hypothetical protein
MPDQYQLFGVSDLARVAPTTAIRQNLVEFFRWAFVDAGAYAEVPVRTPGTPDPYGGEALAPIGRDGVADGTVWQAPHGGWVHETGLVSGRTPTVASGVYVAGTFYPTATTVGAYAHSLDFVHGRVTFAAPVPTGVVVQAAYAYRWVQFYEQTEPWFRPVVLGDFTESRFAAAAASGVVALLDDLSLQPPLVAVEAPNAHRLSPYQIGSFAHWVDQPVLFHVLAGSEADRDSIADAISLQKDRAVTLFDPTARRAAGDFRLDWRGSPTPSGSTYPGLVRAYPWNTLYFVGSEGSPVDPALPLFRAVVRLTVRMPFLYA